MLFEIGLCVLALNAGFLIAAVMRSGKIESLQDEIGNLNAAIAKRDEIIDSMSDCMRKVMFAVTDDDTSPADVSRAISKSLSALENIR